MHRRRRLRGSPRGDAWTRSFVLSIVYLLDTNIVSEPIRAEPDPGVLDALSEHDGEVAICSIVWHEMRFGAARLATSRKRRAIEAYLDEVVQATLPILPYDAEAAEWHAVERARLGKRGRPPPAADGQIAGIAAINDLVLVTANLKDFRRFKGLRVETWHSR